MTMSTANVRPIEDVVADLRKVLVRMLPGSQAVRASWAVLNEAHELYRMADATIHEVRATPEYWTSAEELGRDSFVWKSLGEHYAAARIIRAIADAFGVANMVDDDGKRVRP